MYDEDYGYDDRRNPRDYDQNYKNYPAQRQPMNRNPMGPDIDQYIRDTGRSSGSEPQSQGLSEELKTKIIEFFENFVNDRSTKISSMAKVIIALIQDM